VGHPVTGALCRLLIGIIFIYTAYPKLLRPDEFARLVNGYRILHPDLVNLAGVTLPWIELVVGGFLVIGLLPRSSALVIAGLLVIFMFAGFLGILRGLDIDCGCFFPFMLDHKLGWDLLLRDAVLLLLPLQVLIWPSSFLPARAAQAPQ
jgi:uncharacterized membrane protein YphA (DoxX/SURF4 family)